MVRGLPVGECAELEFCGCAVYILDIRSLTEADFEQVARILPNRYARADEFYFLEDRLRCLGAGKLLIDKLGIEREEQIVFTESGKPKVPGFPFFNLSHSGNYVLMAVASCPVGVDIERVEEKHLGVAKRAFTENERMWMDQDPLERFYVLWTQKEAALKLGGEGLSADPRSFEMRPSDSLSTTVLQGKRIDVASFCHHDYVASVARYHQD